MDGAIINILMQQAKELRLCTIPKIEENFYNIFGPTYGYVISSLSILFLMQSIVSSSFQTCPTLNFASKLEKL
jgi:hypothetical protein